MARLRAGEDVLRPAAAHAEDDVVLAQVDALEGEGEDGQERLVVVVHQRQALHERGAHVHLPEGRIDQIGSVDGGVDRGAGEDFVQGDQDALGAPHLIQIVVDDGQLHHLRPLCR